MIGMTNGGIREFKCCTASVIKTRHMNSVEAETLAKESCTNPEYNQESVNESFLRRISCDSSVTHAGNASEYFASRSLARSWNKRVFSGQVGHLGMWSSLTPRT